MVSLPSKDAVEPVLVAHGLDPIMQADREIKHRVLEKNMCEVFACSVCTLYQQIGQIGMTEKHPNV